MRYIARGMQAPPRISEVPPKVVDLEVLSPIKGEQYRREEGPPIHALSALVMLAVDSLWALAIWEPPVWILVIPLCFVATFVPVYFIQRHLRKDSPGRACAFASVLAVLAALPFPIASTPVGLGLLAWTGLGKLFPHSPQRK
jgi:hypothetical protein